MAVRRQSPALARIAHGFQVLERIRVIDKGFPVGPGQDIEFSFQDNGAFDKILTVEIEAAQCLSRFQF